MAESGGSQPLSDGRHPVIVVDASGPEAGGDERADAGAGAAAGSRRSLLTIDVMVTVGPAKGTIVTIKADVPLSGGSADHNQMAVDLLGLPGDLIVENGQPRLELDEV